jgi:hypothetical protein
MGDEFSTIEGILMKVSSPGEFQLGDRKGIIDYYYLGIKTDDGKRVMVYVTLETLGFFGDFNKSKMYYFSQEKKREIKTSITQLERYIGYRFKITGFLEVLDEKDRKYKMNRVQRCVIYLK